MTFVDPLLSGTTIDRIPPRVLLSWAATARGAAFGGYNIYRRPRGAAVYPWVKVGAIGVPAGYTAATVEAQHNSFLDEEIGWAVAQTRWAAGWDYDFRVVDATTGLESVVGTSTVVGVVVPGGATSWVTCNAAPWLSAPVFVHETSTDAHSLMNLASSASMLTNISNYEVLGRDGGFTRTRLGTPPRTVELSFEQAGAPASDVFDTLRAASVSGRQLCLNEMRGDRFFGVLQFPDITRGATKIDAKAKFAIVAPTPVAADYNRPAAVVLNGTTQYASTAAATSQNPRGQPFAVMVCGVFANHANDVYLSNGAVAANAVGAYGFYCPSLGQMRFRVHGSLGSLDLTSTDGRWFDKDTSGNPNTHVAVAVYDGTNYSLYLDGMLVAGPTSGAGVGSVINGAAFVAGADNGGASGFTASTVQAWGLWGIGAWPAGVVTPLAQADVTAIARYLLGYWGYRMPAGAALLYNLADARCWNGVDTNLRDLAGLQQNAVLTAAPSTKGIPGSLADLDKQW